MWLIPGKTKVRLEIFKGVSLFDILIGALGVGFLILVFLSNFVNKIVIAAVVLVIFVVLLIRVDETPNYEIILCILRYLFCTKTFRKKEEGVKSNGKDIRELCAFTSIEKNLIRYGNNYVGAVLEIPAIEFRLFSKTRKANAIVSGVGGIIRNMNPSCGVNIVKLERPVHYEKYHESEVAKLEELRKSYEMGSLSEEELKARVDIIYGRLDELNHMMGDRKVIVPFYYIVLFDADERQLENQVRAAMLSLTNAEMKPKRLDNKELALFLKYSNDGTVDESELDELEEKDYAAWAMPQSVKIHSTKVEIDDIVTHEMQVTDYPLMEHDAWLATVMTIPATKVVVKCTGMDLGRAIKDIDKSIFELRGQMRQTSVQSRLIELNQHMESLSSLLVTLKGENEVLVKTNVYISGYDVVTTEKMGRADIAKASNLPRITNMRHTVKRIFSEQNLKTSSPMFEQFNMFVGSQISAYDPFAKEGRSIPGNSVAASFPWVFARVEDENGIKLGSTDQVPVFMNFFKRDSERVNSNLVIVGKSGSGKSYTTKSILANLAADNVKIFVLDPENEYTELAENLHGKFINVANSQHGRLNPFNIITALEDGDTESIEETGGVSGSYATHLQFLEEFFKQIMPDCDKDSLEYLNTIVDHMYLERGITPETNLMKLKPEDFPTFDTLYDAVLSEFQRTENDYIRTMLRSLMNYISKFASGGRNASIWNGPSSITTDENFTVFNFQTLLANRNATIANAQMLLVLKYIDNEIIKNREYNKRYHMNRKIAVVIDEAHVFIDTKFPVALDFMFQLAKRIRKYNGMQIVITQNIKDFVGSEDIARKSSAIINASQYSLIFSLAPNDLSDLCKLYEKSGGINEIEQEKIGTAPRGLAFSVLSPMQRTTFQVETSKNMVRLFNDLTYTSPYFVGNGGSENWDNYLGESKQKRAANFLSKVDSEEEKSVEDPVASHVHFDELNAEESAKMLEEREEEPALTPETLTEKPVMEPVQAPREQSDEERLLMLKLLQQMSADNINMKIREQVNALMESMKTEEKETSIPVEVKKPEEEVSAPALMEEETPLKEEVAIKEDIPVAEEIPALIPEEEGESDTADASQEDPFADLITSDSEEMKDLNDILTILSKEAVRMEQVSNIERMLIYEEKRIPITIDDLKRYIRNIKTLP